MFQSGFNAGVRDAGQGLELNAIIAPPQFVSGGDYIARLGDDAFWAPYVEEVLGRHDLLGRRFDLAAGSNPTYPTFIRGDVVIKLFGYVGSWRKGFAAERAALTAVAGDLTILAPRMLADGRLFDDPDAPWPYLITSAVAGTASSDTALTAHERRAVAVQLGEQIRHLHGLCPRGVAGHEDWRPIDMATALQESSLPRHLAEQADAFIARLAPFDRVFVHGDLCANHVFVCEGRLNGIIDWGDALVTDRHYELIQLYRDMFACDKALFRAFLDASNWPVMPDFPRQTLGLALYRQAIGLVQHRTMDVFEPIAAQIPLGDVATLDELALALFRV